MLTQTIASIDYSLTEVVILLVMSVVAGAISGMGGAGGPLLMATFLKVFALPPANIAGTSSLVFMGGTFAFGSAYIYSGDINWRIVGVMILPTLAGIWIGVYLNQFFSSGHFRIILALLLLIIGTNILYRQFRELRPVLSIDPRRLRDVAILAMVGISTGIISGLTGFGGAGLIIPLLILFGVTPIVAVGSGIVQGMFITTTTSTSYIVAGTIDFDLVLLSGIPFLLAGFFGWRIAHLVNQARLKVVIGIVLLILVPYIVMP